MPRRFETITYYSRIGFLGEESEEMPFSEQDYLTWLTPYADPNKPVNTYRVYKVSGTSIDLVCLIKASCAGLALGAVANRMLGRPNWACMPVDTSSFQSHIAVDIRPGGYNRYRGSTPFEQRNPAYLYYLGSLDFLVQKV